MKTYIPTIKTALAVIIAVSPATFLRAQQLSAPAARAIPMPKEPDNRGPLKLICASWLGGSADDEFAGAGIAKDGSIFLALNGMNIGAHGAGAKTLGSAAAQPAAPAADKSKKGNGGKKGAGDQPGATGFIVHLSGDGQRVLGVSQFPAGAATIEKLRVTDGGDVFVLAKAKASLAVGGASGTGAFVTQLSPDAAQAKWALFREGASDFGVDGNGEIVVLTKGHLARFKPGASGPLWEASFASHGDNRPGGMTLSPQTGVAAVTGYGMTKTGHEPWKDPYAYGFDRAGKQLWSLWNPDPTKQAAGKYGGSGLMADTSGMFCASDEQGKVFIALRSDGGNTVSSRDPADPFKKLDPAVLAGVFQPTPGFGFRGASNTSVIYRADAVTGNLEKGTYMCSWITPGHANGLMIRDAAADGRLQFVVGDSSASFRDKAPWFEAPEGGYKGGGFLAMFDRDFRMLQGGYFPGTSIRCVAARGGTVVIAGSAKEKNTASDNAVPGATEITYGVPAFKALQPAFGGGANDGYFAIFHVAK